MKAGPNESSKRINRGHRLVERVLEGIMGMRGQDAKKQVVINRQWTGKSLDASTVSILQEKYQTRKDSNTKLLQICNLNPALLGEGNALQERNQEFKKPTINRRFRLAPFLHQNRIA